MSNDNNITELFGAEATEADDATEHNYLYRITTKDNVVHEVEGFIVVNSLMVAVGRGEGILHFIAPWEDMKTVENLGPVAINKSSFN